MANDNGTTTNPQPNQDPNTDNDQAGSAGVGDPNANDFTANENALSSAPNTRPERDANSGQGATDERQS